MIIDLIRPPNPYSSDDLLDEPLGLMCLASSLIKAGYEARITDLAGCNFDNWKDKIKLDADIYGIQLFTPTAHIGNKIVRFLKHFTKAYVIAGGPHVSAIHGKKSYLEDFDVIIVGEGEEEIVNLADELKENSYIEPKNIGSSSIINLDCFLPADDLVDMMSYHRKVNGKRSFGIITSRGCPYRCSFCDLSLFGNKVRYRSIDNVMLEILKYIEKYNVRSFEFFDDIFALNKNRLELFYKRSQGLNLEYRCNSRVDTFTPEIAKLLKDSGCVSVAFGIESGNQRMLDLMNKRTLVEENYRAVQIATCAELESIGYFIIGFPGETKESIQDTIKFIKKSKISKVQAYCFQPLPGTDPFNNPDKYGIKNLNKDFSKYWFIQGNREWGQTIDTKWLSSGELNEEMGKVMNFVKEYNSKNEKMLQDFEKKLIDNYYV